MSKADKINYSLALIDYLFDKEKNKGMGRKYNFNRKLAECTAARNLNISQNCILFHLSSMFFCDANEESVFKRSTEKYEFVPENYILDARS